MKIELQVNGVQVKADVEPRLTLADFLRTKLRLTGTHLGCEHGVCGACTVLVDGAAVRSCLMFAVQAEGLEVLTVEGLSDSGEISRLQQCFHKHHALQCGFCTPGLLTTASAFLAENQRPTRQEVADAISGNICRCTGYLPIVDAILDAAGCLQDTGSELQEGSHGLESHR
ncbi:MAG: (2Fe-2S)-binding protein [Pigmentiphaga sp.]